MIVDPDPSYCPRCGRAIAIGDLLEKVAPPQNATPAATTESPTAPTPAQLTGGIVEGRYYLLVFLAVAGGILGFRAVRRRNPRVAATILTLGLLVSVIYIGAGYEVYSRVNGPPGVYGMTITGVTFPNSSTVAVTVVNQGTLADGLESVAINNGSLWLVYGLLQPSGAGSSAVAQTGALAFSLYGYILANGTTIPVGSESVGTEVLSPSHLALITLPYAWTPVTKYLVAITTSSDHPNQQTVVSPVST
jgi:hypothetical protein